MTEQAKNKLVRENERVYRAHSEQEGTHGVGYVRSNVKLSVELQRYSLITSFLNKEEARMAQYHAAQRGDMLINEKTVTAREAGADPENFPDSEKLDIKFWAPVEILSHRVGTISADGLKRYDGTVRLELHIGDEESSHAIYYSGDEDSPEDTMFLAIYIGRHKMERLHAEMISRPNATLKIKFELQAFYMPSELGDTWGSFEWNRPSIYLEPSTSAPIRQLNLELSGPKNLSATPEEIWRAHTEWEDEFRAKHEEVDGRIGPSDTALIEENEGFKRRESTIIRAAHDIAARHIEQGEDTEALKRRLSAMENLVEELDAEIHEAYGPFKHKEYLVWKHLEVGALYQAATPRKLNNFVENGRFDVFLSQYFQSHQGRLQVGYLDWLFIDLFAARKLVAVMEEWMKLRHGIAYELFEGRYWKMLVWKIVMWPLGFFIGWILPAIGFLYLAESHEILGFGLLTLYYGFGFIQLVRLVMSHFTRIRYGLKSPKGAVMYQLEQIEKVYQLLSTPVLYAPIILDAFKRSAEAGVLWDPHIFYLLENVIKRDEKMWFGGRT